MIRKKNEKNKQFISDLIELSDIDSKIKDKLLYILNYITISCREEDDKYTLQINSNQSTLAVYLEFKLKKESNAPTLVLTVETNELESILANAIKSSIDIEEFISLCEFNSLYKNYCSSYNFETSRIPLRLILKGSTIVLRNAYDDCDVFELGWNYQRMYTSDLYRSEYEDALLTIRQDLAFFTKNIYVNKNNIPEQLKSFEYDKEKDDILVKILKDSDLTNSTEKKEKYYIELASGFKELQNVEEINDSDTESDNYICTFNDGSTLEFSKSRLFVVTKRGRSTSEDEKNLELK